MFAGSSDDENYGKYIKLFALILGFGLAITLAVFAWPLLVAALAAHMAVGLAIFLTLMMEILGIIGMSLYLSNG